MAYRLSALTSVFALVCALVFIAALPATAQRTLARLDPADCPFAGEQWAAAADTECRWLVVPMDRSRTDGPDVRLFVVVVHAERRTGLPPLVMLHGGPGQSSLVPMVRGAMQQAPLDRDMVFYDQRGAGLSEPDPCPEYAARVRELQASEPVGSSDAGAREAVARECVASMRARGLDPAAFSTATNAADLADLRRALGYDRWDIYGASYGARLALEAMRRDPHGIRAATLENPLPPGPEDADAPLATQNALQRVFAACGRSPACDSAFPGLERTFLEVFDTLVRTTLTVPATEASARDIALDGDGFALAVRRVLRSREGIASLPLLLHELHAGDRAQAARELVRLAEGAGSATRAVFWLVQCYDQYGPDFTDRLDTVRSMVWRPLRSVRENFAECPLWQTESAKPDERAPLVSDIPTLILTGEFDARTPIEFGRRIASTLSNAYVFEFPGETHGGRPVGCRASILVQFLADPLRAPDASCIERMPSFEFRTGWAGGVSRDDPSV